MSRSNPVHAGLNTVFEPQPIRTGFDVTRGQLNANARPYTPHSTPSRNSTNPSPSSTLYSSGAATLDADFVRKLFMDVSPAPPTVVEPVGFNPLSLDKVWMPTQLPQLAYAGPFAPNNLARRADIQNFDDSVTPVQSHFNRSTADQTNTWKMSAPPPLEVAPYPSSVHFWSKTFNKGRPIGNPDFSVQYARAIVRSGRWSEDEVADLARAFVWSGSDKTQDMDTLAAFADRVRTAFAEGIPASTFSEKFSGFIAQFTSETFAGFFHAAYQRKPLDFYNPSPEYVNRMTSALYLCKFVGCLYLHKFLNRHDTKECIRILFRNMAVVEHLLAIENILRHAGSRFWREAGVNLDVDVTTFCENLVEASKQIQYDIAVIPYGPNTAATIARIKAIVGDNKVFLQNNSGTLVGPNLAIRP
ncbi:hypothetical protein BDZ97DRAFT_562017 [Flammula alnicola]|nr:hypothetical protein BDZ97DRAFT_562017 [Flammula alnicola]